MSRNKRRRSQPQNPTTADIRRLQNKGLDKSEIVARLTGTRNNSGGARRLSAHDLDAIGFSDRFIKNTKGHLPNHPVTRPSRNNGGGGSRPAGGGGGGGPQDGGADLGGDLGGDFGGGEDTGGGFDEGAYQIFASILGSWGIPMGPDIAGIIQAAMMDGYTPDDMELLIPDIQNTDTWKARFPGWQSRVSNGYNQISVGEYLALESSYHRILQSSGLPSGFYDDPADFGNWIANNVSPDELQSRVGDAMDLVRQVDPTARNLLTQFYGVGSGDLAAYFLDSKRALPTLDRQYKAVNVASWAAKNGLTVADAKHYEDLVDKGVTADMAAQGYGTVAQMKHTLTGLGEVYGVKFDQKDAENDVFFNMNEKRRQIVNKERAAFSGTTGYNSGVSGRGSTAGSY